MNERNWLDSIKCGSKKHIVLFTMITHMYLLNINLITAFTVLLYTVWTFGETGSRFELIRTKSYWRCVTKQMYYDYYFRAATQKSAWGGTADTPGCSSVGLQNEEPNLNTNAF